MDGKRAVVTGATSGIGRKVATDLARSGAHVVLACRDLVRAEALAAEIGASGGWATAMELDLAEQRSVRTFAARFRERWSRLDVLVNNGGTLLPDRQLSPDGIELTFATNVLGPHLLTAELLGALEAGAPARIVNVASTFAYGIDLDDLEYERRPYVGLDAYAQSKGCDRLLTWALARRLDPARVTANAVAPGLVLGTDLYRRLSRDEVRELERYGSRSIDDGAETVTWLCTSPAVRGVTGTFFERLDEQRCELRDRAVEDRLWDRCDEVVGRAPASA